ncbi:uncharacterized protein LY89DRAFT_748408, partial [Mollisia scopiformis]
QLPKCQKSTVSSAARPQLDLLATHATPSSKPTLLTVPTLSERSKDPDLSDTPTADLLLRAKKRYRPNPTTRAKPSQPHHARSPLLSPHLMRRTGKVLWMNRTSAESFVIAMSSLLQWTWSIRRSSRLSRLDFCPEVRPHEVS